MTGPLPAESRGQVLARMGIDAAKWTDEWMLLNPDAGVDWGTTEGWIVNAIDAGQVDWRQEPPTT